MPAQGSRSRKIDIVILALILAIGISLRIPPRTFSSSGPLHSIAALHPTPAYMRIGFDEGMYWEYVNALVKEGTTSYPNIVERYIDAQQKLPGSILPPVRFLYIFAAYLWHCLFGSEAFEALYQVAAFFSVLTVCLATIFAWRLRGSAWALAMAGLMAFVDVRDHDAGGLERLESERRSELRRQAP